MSIDSPNVWLGWQTVVLLEEAVHFCVLDSCTHKYATNTS